MTISIIQTFFHQSHSSVSHPTTNLKKINDLCLTAAAFQFAPSHDVTEVDKKDYDSCSAANPIKSYTGGSAAVKLTAPGKRYFICSVTGHCASGMKLEVTVAVAAVTAPTTRGASHPRTQTVARYASTFFILMSSLTRIDKI